MVFTPASDLEQQSRWQSLDSCVWKSPPWFTFKTCLSKIHGYERLYGLFVNTLGARDSCADDYLQQLSHIKESLTGLSREEEAEIVCLLYTELNEKARDASVKENVQ